MKFQDLRHDVDWLVFPCSNGVAWHGRNDKLQAQHGQGLVVCAIQEVVANIA